MKIVDARGLSCPEPIVLMKQAIKQGLPVKVLLSDRTPLENILRVTNTDGLKTTVTENGNEFEVVIEK